jgi:hypothetical protein
MKRIILIAFVSCFALSAFSQGMTETASKPNGIKINVMSLAVGHLALQYERVIGPHFTACMGVRFRPKMRFGNSNSFQDNTTQNDVIFGEVKYGSYAFTPEFRYYVREAGRGFYIAPYIRYRITPFDINFSYTDDNNRTQSDVFSGNINAFVGGIMIGSNFYLSDNLSLDWFIIGGHYGRNNFDLNWRANQPLSASEQSDFIDRFEELKDELPSNFNLDYQVNSSGFAVDTKYGAVGFRAAGLNLVYKF